MATQRDETTRITDEKHRRFLLQSLRAASLNAKLWAEELTLIGQTLKDDGIDNEEAVKWIGDCGLMWLVRMAPERLALIAKAQETPQLSEELS
jgi:hypothetical protein